MVVITDAAKVIIQEELDKNQGKYLRLYAEGFGWGGPRVGLTLDEPKANEKPVQVNGIGVLIDEFDEVRLGDMTVDYVKEAHNEGFVIKRPDGAAC